MIACELYSLEDLFNFGRYEGLSLADVLDINPSYIEWCVKYCTGVIFRLEDTAVYEIKIVYPRFRMDNLFEKKRLWHLFRPLSDNYYHMHDFDDCDEFDEFDDGMEDYLEYSETSTSHRYEGTWAQDVEEYSDDDIDTIFDGDANAYWNID